MHTAGAMLIVASWQSVPFSTLAEIFKRKKILDILAVAFCAIVFVTRACYLAIIFVLIIFNHYNKHSAERGVAK